MKRKPGYIRLYNDGELQDRIHSLEAICRKCTLCPHRCEIDRTQCADGFCASTIQPVIASAAPHFGEEPPLVGRYGSGTIFFSSCTLRCIYCQNYTISHLREGSAITVEQLAGIMLSLQANGCHNINFVTPTHMVLPMVKALVIAIERGLSVPLVYNSSGYDSVETLRLLDGIIDIYMPDMKYHNEKTAYNLSRINNYPQIARLAVKEMHRQVGDLELDEQGIATQGLIVRHLILPGHTDESKRIIDFIAELSQHTYLNLMDQYRPDFKAFEVPAISRRITQSEYDDIIAYAILRGVTKGLEKKHLRFQ
ncbi:MAG: radical SAM protein [Bacteroidales bacterium]|nr:radical SAM protein [Bacteroidales bacterium]